VKVEYALAKQTRRSSDLTYWTGEYTKTGRPVVNRNKDEAMRFNCARDAYFLGGISKGLAYFRAVKLYYTDTNDGFISNWWIKEEDDGGQD
jgi:hypothetical protein